MIELKTPYRQATKHDAETMAQLVNLAGEGLPYYLWSQMAEERTTAWEVGRQRAQREEGGFSYKNTIIREEDNRIVSCLIGYALPEQPNPDVYHDMPAMFVPLQQLEDKVCNTWYINVLATFGEFQGRGYGSELIRIAEQISLSEGLQGVSLIVSDANTIAYNLYKQQGFIEKSRLKMIKDDWMNDGVDWVLLVKNN